MEVLRTAILDFCRRKKGKDFSPSEVVRQLFPQDWELFLPDILQVAAQMAKEGLIQLSHDGNQVLTDQPLDAKVMIKEASKLK